MTNSSSFALSFNTLDRYYTINNVKDKTGVHQNIGMGGSYFALKKIREIKEEYYGKKESESDYIFNVKTFANGFNSLLEQSKLKSVKLGLFMFPAIIIL